MAVPLKFTCLVTFLAVVAWPSQASTTLRLQRPTFVDNAGASPDARVDSHAAVPLSLSYSVSTTVTSTSSSTASATSTATPDPAGGIATHAASLAWLPTVVGILVDCAFFFVLVICRRQWPWIRAAQDSHPWLQKGTDFVPAAVTLCTTLWSAVTNTAQVAIALFFVQGVVAFSVVLVYYCAKEVRRGGGVLCVDLMPVSTHLSSYAVRAHATAYRCLPPRLCPCPFRCESAFLWSGTGDNRISIPCVAPVLAPDRRRAIVGTSWGRGRRCCGAQSRPAVAFPFSNGPCHPSM